ncbi:MAG TPA: TonB-dependent receptor, partial [Chitinophagaceae bacterium]|nr:TonB-dependent receptor [Chitinophagaceae bacterium]
KMKRIVFFTAIMALHALVHAQSPATVDDSLSLSRKGLFLAPVEVLATRVGTRAPFTKSNLTKEQIEKLNLGQDLPFLLNQTPSVVVNSDAGNGVGYTGLRIRGSDLSRINVTLNGIPYNDAESQGVFFVDLPDFASSVKSIQIQRGVGTSSNGAGAFGATINISTHEFNEKAYAELNNSYGSFNTWKHTVKAGTGLINDHFTVDARLSRITSDGYIDRATSRLSSFYVGGGYFGKKTQVRLNIFGGDEQTYQAWNGVPESLLKTNRTFNSAGTEKPGEPYDNETDNFVQNHYQFFVNHAINNSLSFNTSFFYTRGKGYYEQYKAGEDFNDYGLPYPVIGNDTLETTDLVRQLWLDNHLYGSIFSLQYNKNGTQLTFGGGWNRFENNHYGKVIWSQTSVPLNHIWYDLDANKRDLNMYGKWQQQLNQQFQTFADLQYRSVKYVINGFRDNPTLHVNNQYHFLNPKVGVTYTPRAGMQAYISYALANKEPNRDDFEANEQQQPSHETLHDVEIGFERRGVKKSFGITAYYMYYRNQLVLTGKINDVGAYTRTNIPESYRAGVELQGSIMPAGPLRIDASVALSRNKISNFVEYVDDYDNGGQKTFAYDEPDIAFSPSIVANATITYKPVSAAELTWFSKYVGKQYLDNTSNSARQLDAYFLNDLRASYTFKTKLLSQVSLLAQVNNLFDVKYEPNGYTFSYIYGSEFTTENFYFPMAGRNFMVGVNVRID